MSDLDKILDDFRTNVVAWDSSRGIKKAEAKSELQALALKALPEKKENTDYEEIATKYPDVPKTIPDMYETGYNQALEDTEKAIRKVLG